MDGRTCTVCEPERRTVSTEDEAGLDSRGTHEVAGAVRIVCADPCRAVHGGYLFRAYSPTGSDALASRYQVGGNAMGKVRGWRNWRDGFCGERTKVGKKVGSVTGLARWDRLL